MGLFGFLTSWRKAETDPSANSVETSQPAAPREKAAASTPAGQRSAPTARAKGGKGRSGHESPAKRTTPASGAPSPSMDEGAARPAAEPPAKTAAATATPVPTVASDGETDLAELDEIFGAGASQAVKTVTGSTQDVDKASIRELFTEIAGQQSAAVKNFVFELKRGTASKDWVEVCRPIMATLVEAADSLGLGDEAGSMKEFHEALSLAGEGDGKQIEQAARELLLEGYEKMAQAIPEAFALGEDTQRREGVVIHSLLKQVPDVGRVTFDRLYGAGLTTLDSLSQANPADLCSTTGIPYWLCERICTKLSEHLVELQRIAEGEGGGANSANVERLRHLLAELKRENNQYEKAAEQEWTDPALAAAKRMARQNRQVCALKIEVLLAEIGEIELVEKFQKLAFDQRIRALDAFLVEAGSSRNESSAARGTIRGA